VKRELGEMIELAGLTPDEQARLQRVHGLLVAAGPPAELPLGLVQPPETSERGAEVVAIAARRRRPAVALLIAAAVAAACFGSGYLLANQAHSSSTRVAQVVSLAGPGQRNSFASLRVGRADAGGNSPIQLTVTGLPPLAIRARYALMLWQGGKPSVTCGTFTVGRNGPTTVRFSVPYTITKTTRWVVTEVSAGAHYPGHVVMTSS
jgi:hypothetical protein